MHRKRFATKLQTVNELARAKPFGDGNHFTIRGYAKAAFEFAARQYVAEARQWPPSSRARLLRTLCVCLQLPTSPRPERCSPEHAAAAAARCAECTGCRLRQSQVGNLR